MRTIKTLLAMFVTLALSGFTLLNTGGIAAAASSDTVPTVTSASALTQALTTAKQHVPAGGQTLAAHIHGTDVWVQNQASTLTVVMSPVGEHPAMVDPTTLPHPTSSPAPGTSTTPDGQTMQPAITVCAAAYGLTGVLIAIGGAALTILAITNPEGVVLFGAFFSAERLNYAATIATSFGVLLSWTSSWIC